MCQQLWWLDAGHHQSTCDHRTTRILEPPNWGYPRPTYSGVREGLGSEKMKRLLIHCMLVGGGGGRGGPQCINLNVIKIVDELMIEYYHLIWLFRMFYWHDSTLIGNSSRFCGESAENTREMSWDHGQLVSHVKLVCTSPHCTGARGDCDHRLFHICVKKLGSVSLQLPRNG